MLAALVTVRWTETHEVQGRTGAGRMPGAADVVAELCTRYIAGRTDVSELVVTIEPEA